MIKPDKELCIDLVKSAFIVSVGIWPSTPKWCAILFSLVAGMGLMDALHDYRQKLLKLIVAAPSEKPEGEK